MTQFKDKRLKNPVCEVAKETKVEKFYKHMGIIEHVNLEALSWLVAIPFEKYALSHDGSQRYGIITTNMSEVLNSILKGTQRLPVTAFVQLTFYRVKSYFVVKRQHISNILTSTDNTLLMPMLRLMQMWLRHVLLRFV